MFFFAVVIGFVDTLYEATEGEPSISFCVEIFSGNYPGGFTSSISTVDITAVADGKLSTTT